jgi:hypothetical protein
MQDTPDVYKQFPYGEVQNKLSTDTVNHLAGLITAQHEPAEGDSVVEHIVASTECDFRHTVQTHLEAFSPMVSNIHAVLVEHQTMPDYMRDTLCALIKAVQDTDDMTVRAQKFILQDVALKDYMQAMWANTELDRLTGSEVKLYQTDVANKGKLSILLRKNETDSWELGIEYREAREYELHSTGYLYRLDGRQIFTDPVGSDGDAANIQDGLYLPSMLKLPKLPTSVTV